MIALLTLPARSVYYLPRTAPAVFFLADHEGGGVLVNTPSFSPRLAARLNRIAPVKFAFFPSRLGARDAAAWRAAGARAIAYADELAGCGIHADENRLLGAAGLRHLEYEYAFTDDFDPLRSRYGPGASHAIGRELDALLHPG